MIPFRAPLDDIAFSLTAMGAPPDDMRDEISAHFAALAEGVIAPTNTPGDRGGARLENGRVRVPNEFHTAQAALKEGGWCGLTAPEEFGGMAQDGLTLAAVSEVFSGANQSLQMLNGLVPGAVRTILTHGTEAQKNWAIPPLAAGDWLSTMCLTEPGAGSDLGRIRCRAERQGNAWAITGEKIFITGADQDLSEGILHLVLARSGGEGVGGLSLFLCRGVLPDGTRNAVTVTRIEEKLGLHGSPTCQVVFESAQAELIGTEGQGLKAMFTMMNHARLDVALQGVAQAARAQDIARAYAADRVQGGRPISEHGDVARMIDQMDMLAMGGRGIAHLALVTLESGLDPDSVEVLTPVAKVFCTEAATKAADLGIQVLGGYGYLAEYGLEQIWRDARITRIYEGTNGIHAMMLATRLIHLGSPLDALERLAADIPMLADWQDARATVAATADVGPLAWAFMELTSELVHQVVWARLGFAAASHPDPDRVLRLSKIAFRRAGVAVAEFKAALG